MHFPPEISPHNCYKTWWLTNKMARMARKYNPRAQSLRVFPVYFRFVFYFRFLICVLLFCLRFLFFLFAFSFFCLCFTFFICVFFFLFAFSFFLFAFSFFLFAFSFLFAFEPPGPPYYCVTCVTSLAVDMS